MSANCLTLSYGLCYKTAVLHSLVNDLSSTTTSLPSEPVNVVLSLPGPTNFHAAPYSPPTACLSHNTIFLYPKSRFSIIIVSLEMVTPFQPLRMAPLGLPNIFLSPNFCFCSAVGVMVGSLNIALSLLPAATASCNTLSSVSSLLLQDRS